MRKIYLTIKAKVVIESEEGVEVTELLSHLSMRLSDESDASVIDSEIISHEVTDSK